MSQTKKSSSNKEAKDLLFDVIPNRHTTGLTFTSTLGNGGQSTSSVAARYTDKDGTIVLKFDSNLKLSASIGVNINPVLGSTKTIASFKLPDITSSKIKFLYFHKRDKLISSLVLSRSPAVKFSALLGDPTLQYRMKATFKPQFGFTKLNAGIYAAKPDHNASLTLANDLLKASYVSRFQQSVKSVGVEFTRRFSTDENTFTVAGSHKVDKMTTLKVKINNHGKFETLLSHKVKKQHSLSISSEFDVKALDKLPRIGLNLAVNPEALL